jgi:hypothetical protein
MFGKILINIYMSESFWDKKFRENAPGQPKQGDEKSISTPRADLLPGKDGDNRIAPEFEQRGADIVYNKPSLEQLRKEEAHFKSLLASDDSYIDRTDVERQLLRIQEEISKLSQYKG